MAGRTLKHAAEWLAAAFLYALAGWLYLREHLGTWEWIHLLRMGMLAVLPAAPGLLPLRLQDVLILFPILLLETSLLSFTLWNLPADLLLLMLDLLLFCRFSRRQFVPVCLSVLPAAAGVLVYDLLCTLSLGVYYRFFRITGGGFMEKGFLLLTAAALYTIFWYGIIVLVRRKWAGDSIGTEACRGLEGYILVLFCSAFLFLALAQQIRIPDTPTLLWTDLIQKDPALYTSAYLRYLRLLLTVFQGFVLALHGAYLLLLFRAVRLRKKVQSSEESRAALSRFTADLEENLTDIRSVRHDLQNLLLTMGGFVARSGDTEMQQFWQERITPTLESTLWRSSLFGQLQSLSDEGLKSFLYYKLTQAADSGIRVQLDIRPEDHPFTVSGDLVRLLGIFLDNAMEETALVSGEMCFSLQQTEEGVCFRITNPVRQEILQKGIRPGVSDKGEGRGNGLKSAQNIVSRHDNLLWNSYFTEDHFTQMLFLLKSDTPESDANQT